MNTFVVRAFSFVAALSLALGTAGPAAANQTADTPPPGTVVIDLVTMNGTGCRPGGGTVSVAPDNTAFRFTLGEMQVRIGGSARPGEARRYCQVALRVQPPAGYQYAITRADYEGHADLAAGAAGVLRAIFYFAGSPVQPELTKRFTGPLTDTWQASEQVPESARVWSPCDADRLLNISTSLLALRGTSDPAVTSSFTLASDDGVASVLIALNWRRCP